MKHKLTYTDNYILVVDDSEIKGGDWQIDFKNRLSRFSNISMNLYGQSYKKIIAHLPLNNSTILEGVPLLPPLEVEDDVEMEYHMELEQRREIAKNFKGQVAGRHPDMFGGNEIHHMVRGYLEAKEKYKYTEEDMRKMFEAAIGLSSFSDTDDNKFQYALQSLSQPKMPVAFEFEWMPITPHQYTPEEHLDVEIKTTTNSQGQKQLVGKYIYEGSDNDQANINRNS